MLLAEATKKVNREREEKKERQRREEEEKKRKKEEDEDDDDDDEEELSHWVLPQPLTPIASAVNVEIVAPSGEAAKKQEVAKTKRRSAKRAEKI
jgi:ABC-type Zn2+ transport system substrate-binding protein/surface adhesin